MTFVSGIYTSADMLIGKTPILKLNNIEKKLELHAGIYAKLEYFNPAGSVKDRIAKAMLDDAEKSGRLTPRSVIIEPTSGQHRHRSCLRCRRARIPHNHCHARNDVG